MGFYLTYASQPSKAARQNPTETEGFEDMRLKIILHVVCKNATFRCHCLSLCRSCWGAAFIYFLFTLLSGTFILVNIWRSKVKGR